MTFDLPHNEAAERGVLGALIFENDLYEQVADVVQPSDFYWNIHRQIFEAIVSLIDSGKTATAVALQEWFRQSEDLKRAGGVKLLTGLIESAAFGPEVVDYAKIVHFQAVRRRMIQTGQELVEAARGANGVEPVYLEDIVARAQHAIDGAMQADSRAFVAAPVEAMEALARAASRKGELGLTTGLTRLDRKLGGLFPTDLIVLAARPSIGKTALACSIANSIAAQPVPEGEPGGVEAPSCMEGAGVLNRVVLFFSLEQDREQISQRMLSAETWAATKQAVPYRNMRNGWIKDSDLPLLKKGSARQPNVQIDDRAGISVAYVRQRMQAMKKQRGRLDLVIIDYLQLMSQRRGKDVNTAAAIGEITVGLKALAKEFRVPIVVLSQLSRQVENREDKRPQLSDLRDSGSIEQDADVVLFLYREHYYLERQGEPKKAADREQYLVDLAETEPCVDIIIAKQRNGPIADVRAYWNAECGAYGNDREDVV